LMAACSGEVLAAVGGLTVDPSSARCPSHEALLCAAIVSPLRHRSIYRPVSAGEGVQDDNCRGPQCCARQCSVLGVARVRARP
jgi:hypothetical protein